MAEMTYEKAMNKLQTIVKKLEQGSLSLDETIKLYTEGIELSGFCTKCLEEAKQKITKISSQGE